MAKRIHRRYGEVFKGIKIFTDADETSTFDPSWAFSDASVMTVDWGDRTPKESHATGLSHTYAAGSGRKLVRFNCPDWTKLTGFNIEDDNCRLSLPSFSSCTSLNIWSCKTNQFVGTLPSFATNIALTEWYGYNNLFTGTLPSFTACILLNIWYGLANQFSGTLPSFNNCTALQLWYGYDNQFSGIIPSFAACTALITWRGYQNQFSGYAVGGFATQTFLNEINLHTNNLPEASIDAILADCVISLAVPGRVICNLNLSGVGNAAPSNPAGLADKATLVAAGWTVTTN